MTQIVIRESTKIERKLEVMIIHETLWKSILSDIFTFSLVIGSIGIGWYLGSSALQWAAVAMLTVMLLAAMVKRGATDRLTIEQARDRLDQLEREFLGNTKKIDPSSLKKAV